MRFFVPWYKGWYNLVHRIGRCILCMAADGPAVHNMHRPCMVSTRPGAYDRAMAPTPKPAALKLINGRGNGKDSAGREVVTVPHERLAPRKPGYISEDEWASDEWDRVVPGLDKLQILKPQDVSALAAYCLTYSQWRAAVIDVEDEGTTIYVTVKSADGGTTRKPIVNPVYKVMIERQMTMLKFAKEFGLTPSSETAAWNGKTAPETGTANPFAAGSTG